MENQREPISAPINGENGLSCKLTAPELRQRKATVLANLKRQLIKREELQNGFSYEFEGSDGIVDELVAFVKTERRCCPFFDFSLSIRGDCSRALLDITGPGAAKALITSELEL